MNMDEEIMQEMGTIGSLSIIERQTVTISSEGWKDTDLWWLPNKGSHLNTQFSTNLLKEFIICWFSGSNQNPFWKLLYTGKFKAMKFV